VKPRINHQHPPLPKPLITSWYLSSDWSSTTTASGFSTCDTTAISFVETLVNALTGTPLLSAPNDGAQLHLYIFKVGCLGYYLGGCY